MSYYFPSPLQNLNFPKILSPELKYCFDSGKSALRFILQSLHLPEGSKMAIPAYVCSDVRISVETELFTPVLFDLKNDQTFWTEYDFKRIVDENIKAIVLVHLYGFIHPDTKEISEFCKKNNIFLVHDAAQSYGIDETRLLNGNGTAYSLGPGKATTAAGGGFVKNIIDTDHFKKIKKASLVQNSKAIHFVKTRLYGYKFSKLEMLKNSLQEYILKPGPGMREMTAFQKYAASYVLTNLKNIKLLRKERYRLLSEKIKQNNKLQVAYDDDNGGYFKMILLIKNEPLNFFEYLNKNNVPCFSLAKKKLIYEADQLTLPNYKQFAANFIEISTEASIPMTEMERVATIMAAY